MTYETKDSGTRESFETGAVRDSRIGKGRFDLVPPLPMRRLAQLYERGASKYCDWNWSKGMPFSRFLDSAERHLNDYKAGLRDEDHLAAVVFNAFSMMHQEVMAPDLDDLPRFVEQWGYSEPPTVAVDDNKVVTINTNVHGPQLVPPPDQPGLFDTLFGRIMQTTGQPT